MSELKKAYGYIRVSTEEQAKEGLSLEAQRSKIRAFAEIKDLELVEIISDEGLSGKDFERGGIKKIIDLLDQGEMDALIVYKLDRLSRNTVQLLTFIEKYFQSQGIRFLSVTEQIDTTTAIGKFFLTLMAALAQMERETTIERIKMALDHKKELGERLGTTPLGFKTIEEGEDKGELEEVPDEMKVIKEIFTLRGKSHSLNDICEHLNHLGYKTKRDKNWYPSTVNYILKNEKFKEIAEECGTVRKSAEECDHQSSPSSSS